MLTFSRSRRLCIAALPLACLQVAPAHAAVTGLDRISITVQDPRAIARFYQEALGFRVEVPWHPAADATRRLLGPATKRILVAVLRLGDERVEFDAFDPPGRPYPAGSRSPDLWFQHFALVVSNMQRAYAHLRLRRLPTITVGGPQILLPEDGRVAAFKFRDPNGHPLELLWFPSDQGRARWHERRRKLFQGIDHSAIAVADIAASLRFYRDGLGMRETYATLNRGPVQSRLDGVPGAVVRVTGLRPTTGDGAGIELLQYQSSHRRPAPQAVAADVWKTRLVLEVDNLEATLARLPAEPSRAVQHLPDGSLAVLVQDPDGHSLILEQPAAAAG